MKFTERTKADVIAGIHRDEKFDPTPDQLENIEAWVEALRGGDYLQGQGALRKGDHFCCLGVACDIADANWDDIEYEDEPVMAVYTGIEAEDVPPGNLMPDLFGIYSADPQVVFIASDGSVESDCLSVLNDSIGFTFAMLASAIEDTYLHPGYQMVDR